MGYMKHQALLVTVRYGGMEYAEGIRDSMLELAPTTEPYPFTSLLVGPIQSLVNDYQTIVIVPDGSKEGWDTSDLVDGWIGNVIDALAGDEHLEMVYVNYGGDEPQDASALPLMDVNSFTGITGAVRAGLMVGEGWTF